MTVTQSEAPSNATEPDSVAPQRKSAAVRLVEMTQERYELGCTDEDETFGASKSQPHIAMLLRGGRAGLRADIAARVLFGDWNAASGQALTDAVAILEGFAAQKKPERLYLRVADAHDAVYIDTGRLDGQVIRIADGTWSISPAAPVADS